MDLITFDMSSEIVNTRSLLILERMSRATIPPTALPPGPGPETFDVLQHKLAQAEDDTQHLVNTLTQMGFRTDGKGNVLSR